MLFHILENRSLENPAISLTDSAAWDEAFGTGSTATSDEKVTEETALGIPAVWQAVNLISGTIASLPLQLYRSTEGGAEKADKDPLYRIVHDQANDVHTSFAWRKWAVARMLLAGRCLTLIVYNKAGRVTALVPLDLNATKIDQRIQNGRLVRTYTVGSTVYQASEILDFNPFPKSDGVGNYCPILIEKNALGLMLAAERNAASVFANGGVPPLSLSAPAGAAPASPQAQERASKDINRILRDGESRKRKILHIPGGYELKDLGFDPQKQQLLEARAFQISEVSRIFNIAPAMLHDLTHGTYSNVEQQNLNFAQHTIAPLVKLMEQEMNSKLFGLRNTSNYVEFNLDGLQRGDFTSRMNGLAKAVQTALLTPNEARSLDNRAPLEGGDQLLIQGATIPVTSAGSQPIAPPKPTTSEDGTD